jgi:hypothetical protein
MGSKRDRNSPADGQSSDRAPTTSGFDARGLAAVALPILVGLALNRAVPQGSTGLTVALVSSALVAWLAYGRQARDTRISLAWSVSIVTMSGLIVYGTWLHYSARLSAYETPPNVFMQTYIKGQNFRLADLAWGDVVVWRDKVFEDCEIYGPGIIVMADDTKLVDSGWDLPPEIGIPQSILEHIIIPVPVGQTLFAGIICTNCQFRHTRFHGVQVVATPNDKMKFMQAEAEEQRNRGKR